MKQIILYKCETLYCAAEEGASRYNVNWNQSEVNFVVCAAIIYGAYIFIYEEEVCMKLEIVSTSWIWCVDNLVRYLLPPSTPPKDHIFRLNIDY